MPITKVVLIGCGKMGSAIAEGLLSTASPRQRIWNIKACVRSTATYDQLMAHPLHTNNPLAFIPVLTPDPGTLPAYIQPAALVVLATKPKDAVGILQNQGVRNALRGKLLISVVFGMSEDSILSHLSSETVVVSALPNIAASAGQSATITVADPSSSSNDWGNSPPADDESTDALRSDFLNSIGRVFPLQPAAFGPGAVLSGTMPAFVSEFVAGLLDAANTLGVDGDTAKAIVQQGLRGTADLLDRHNNALDIVDRVATKGGVTEAGLNVLREGKVKEAATNALLKCDMKMRGQ
ncbi:pyrroline-5-carboxylate reductase dimerization-domain-containing protein [Nemania sp. NC0429]|nr:pyrroline-5-carboxylate reductase dimerization-domain-containing protein [Nemania sp. NC0429]